MAFQFFNKTKDQDQSATEKTPTSPKAFTSSKEPNKSKPAEIAAKPKTKEQTKTSVQTSTITTSKSSKSEPKLITVTFYGKNIRLIYQDGRILFPIQDILTIAGVLPTSENVERLSMHEKLASNWSKITEKISVTTDNGKEEIIVSENTNILHITPYVDGSFPGPFSRWVIGIADTLNPDEVAQVKPTTI